MKAYITSVGEKTTKLCCDQLERFGFEVILLDTEISWFDKYRRFINIANEDCLRIDADIIPNANTQKIAQNGCLNDNYLMIQYSHYDLYKNDISVGNPVFYKREAIEIIRQNINQFDRLRPETSAWRLPEIVKRTYTSDLVCGLHGFFQSRKDMERVYESKKARGQLNNFDFGLVNKLIKL